MREQRKNNYNRKLAWKLQDLPLSELIFSVVGDYDIQKRMSPKREVNI